MEKPVTALMIKADPELAALPPDMQAIGLQAKMLIAAKMAPKDYTWQQLLLIGQTGAYFDLPLQIALKMFYVVYGSVAPTPAFLLARAYQSGHVADFQILERTDTVATVAMRRRGVASVVRWTFTIQDAKRLGFLSRDNGKGQWTGQPSTMLMWRAISALCRVLFPDALLGVPDALPEDLGAAVAYDESGNVEAITIPEQQPAAPIIEVADDLSDSRRRNALFEDYKTRGLMPPDVFALAKQWFNVNSLTGLSDSELRRRLDLHLSGGVIEAADTPAADPFDYDKPLSDTATQQFFLEHMAAMYGVEIQEIVGWCELCAVDFNTMTRQEGMAAIRHWATAQSEVQDE